MSKLRRKISIFSNLRKESSNMMKQQCQERGATWLHESQCMVAGVCSSYLFLKAFSPISFAAFFTLNKCTRDTCSYSSAHTSTHSGSWDYGRSTSLDSSTCTSSSLDNYVYQYQLQHAHNTVIFVFFYKLLSTWCTAHTPADIHRHTAYILCQPVPIVKKLQMLH